MKKRLKVGVKIVVVVSKPGSVSAQKTLTIRRNKAPLVSTRCIAPGATRAQACG